MKVIIRTNGIQYNLTQIWHQCFGHYNFKSLHLISYKGLATNIPQLLFQGKSCHAYKFQKHSKKVPKKSLHKTNTLFELVHTYFSGPLL